MPVDNQTDMTEMYAIHDCLRHEFASRGENNGAVQGFWRSLPRVTGPTCPQLAGEILCLAVPFPGKGVDRLAAVARHLYQYVSCRAKTIQANALAGLQ